MKIRITEPGWQGYSDLLGTVAFIDGVSVEDVSAADARHLAALVAIENVDESGPAANIAAVIASDEAARAPAPLATLQTLDKLPADTPAPDRVFTAEELAEIADKEGIKGIRAIAEPRGLRDNSIRELIAKILAGQPAA